MQGFELTDEARAVAAAMELDPEKFGDPELKSQRIGDAASVVSAIPSVREALVSFQRQFAADPPGAVLDGRDIGTVICPNAEVKIFVVADPQVRARRRTLEARARGEAADEALVLADILKRDERDQNRAAAPLKAAADAHILDNSNLDIEGGVRAAIAIVEAVRARRSSGVRSRIRSVLRPVAVERQFLLGHRNDGLRWPDMARIGAGSAGHCRQRHCRW